MSDTTLSELIARLQNGTLVPFLGAQALNGSVNAETGAPIPADSDSLILAMNGGKPMAPKLMYEFARAAMNQELKKGRSFIQRFLVQTYANTAWSRAPMHDWLAELKPHYVVDINRDTQLQESYKATPHTLIVGIARMSGKDYRFKIYHYDGSGYTEINQDEADPSLPILFKPLGTPTPEPTFIASDADYVDYITELMGGFAIPSFLKEYRKNKQYLFIGLRLNRDTERMVMSDIVYGAGSPTGYALIPGANDKEKRFCAKMGIEVIDASVEDLLAAAGKGLVEAV
ncbi:MAG: SIR2 family protein [Alphaproteobacteria bacterium CG_4_10_14_0_2_um_filter_63_37]|nr:MAG: SIR2 family protein [Proteobacteria bacterium CG1_02_64_396]PJA25189.1 MAG: SIR2 family protein [Alphaproteobacteria bacterium CG_4_10_14_0_2_um_filter_63_37]